MRNHKRPEQKTLKPMNLFESELIPFESIDVMSAAQPRYIVVYHHLTKEEAKRIIQHLEDCLNRPGATVTLPIIGRMVN